jgi:hypothetical protein
MAEEKQKGPKGGKPTAERIAARKAAKKAQKQQVETARRCCPQQPAPPPRLNEHYREKVVPRCSRSSATRT